MANVYEFELTDINHQPLPLAEFSGRPLLIVNVASQCGLTPQYEQLEALYQRYQDKGLLILGVPCNQFGGQEPWPEQQIQVFCTQEYHVSFPMTCKLEVNGENRHALYEWLAGEQAVFPGDISWNFEKFLIDREGQVAKRFEPSLEPNAYAVIKAIESVI